MELIGLLANGDEAGSLRFIAGLRSSLTPEALKAAVNSCDQDQHVTPLHVAAQKGFDKVVTELLSAGADSMRRLKGTGNTPGHLAAFQGHVGAVKALVKAPHLTARHHIEVYDARNAIGDSPLMMASFAGHLGVVAALLNAKSDPSLRNGDGINAAMCAAGQGHDQVLRLLLRHPGQVLDGELTRSRDKRGRNPLHFAAEKGSVPCVDMLIKAGADPTQRNQMGRTPLDEAERSGSVACADLIRAAVAELEAKADAAAAALLLAKPAAAEGRAARAPQPQPQRNSPPKGLVAHKALAMELPPSASFASASASSAKDDGLDVEADESSGAGSGTGGRSMSFQMLGADMVADPSIPPAEDGAGDWVQVARSASKAVRAQSNLSPRPMSPQSPSKRGHGPPAPPPPAPLPSSSASAIPHPKPSPASRPVTSVSPNTAAALAQSIVRPQSPLRPGSPAVGGLRRVDSGTLKDVMDQPAPARDVTALVAAKALWDEADEHLRAMVPFSADLDIQPYHVLGVGIDDLSAGQLEGIEAALHALQALVGEARMRRAVQAERERMEADYQLDKELGRL